MVCHAEEPTWVREHCYASGYTKRPVSITMTTIAIVLLIISAFTHAGWNFISKKEHPTQAFYLVANTIGVICILPLLFYYASFYTISFRASVWLIVIMSGFFLASYMGALAGAYRAGDISIAYPLTRSLPVILVFLLTLMLGFRPTPGRMVFRRYNSCRHRLHYSAIESIWRLSFFQLQKSLLSVGCSCRPRGHRLYGR